MMKRNRQPLSLPIELYGHIVDEVEAKRDLLSLLLVSRALHAEAERALYREVVYENAYTSTVEHPFQQIARYERTARQVKSIMLTLETFTDPTSFAAALQVTTNLRSLFIHSAGWNPLENTMHTLLNGVSFQLRRLTLFLPTTTKDGWVKPFMHLQNQSLQELHFCSWSILSDLTSDLESKPLPNLSVLGIQCLPWMVSSEDEPAPPGMGSVLKDILSRGQIRNFGCTPSIINLLDITMPSIRALRLSTAIDKSGIQRFPNITYLGLAVDTIEALQELVTPLRHLIQLDIFLIPIRWSRELPLRPAVERVFNWRPTLQSLIVRPGDLDSIMARFDRNCIEPRNLIPNTMGDEWLSWAQ